MLYLAVLKPQEHLHLPSEISFCVTSGDNVSAGAEMCVQNVVTALSLYNLFAELHS